MTNAERRARIGELLELRIPVADLLERIDARLKVLGYELAPRDRAHSPTLEVGMKRSNTVTGKPFYYDGSISGDIIIYPTDRDGVKCSGARVPIPPQAIDFIRAEIRKAGEIPMGACRDNPVPGSLGDKLRQQHKSPQLLSYVIPLLTEEGFCTYFKVGRRYMIRCEGPPPRLS